MTCFRRRFPAIYPFLKCPWLPQISYFWVTPTLVSCTFPQCPTFVRALPCRIYRLKFRQNSLRNKMIPVCQILSLNALGVGPLSWLRAGMYFGTDLFFALILRLKMWRQLCHIFQPIGMSKRLYHFAPNSTWSRFSERIPCLGTWVTKQSHLSP